MIVGLYAVGTIKRNYVWRDDYTLWSDTVKKSPDNAIAHYNLGIANAMLSRFDEAIKEYKIALVHNPKEAEIHNNLGLAYDKQGQYEESIKALQAAIWLKPYYVDAHRNLGTVYRSKGLLNEAIKEYRIV